MAIKAGLAERLGGASGRADRTGPDGRLRRLEFTLAHRKVAPDAIRPALSSVA